MLTSSRKTLTAIATVSALAGGGAALAGAATNGGSSKPSSARPQQTALTGDTADKVKAAALDKVPGGTVLRVEEGGPDGSKYHAHVRKADGTEVVVLVDASFEATSVQADGPGGPGGPGHRGPGGGPRQEALTGDTAAKVKAAALAKVPGGTVLRVEAGGPGGSKYHAHVRKSDGTEVTVLVNSSFEATSVETRPAGGPGGPGGPGGRGHGGPGGPGDVALTGDTAAKVKAAALEKVPGGTVVRAEKGGHGSTYHAHVRKADGTEVVVLVNSSFEVTSVEDMPKHP
ncbi:MAG: hypothetical protein QOE38_1923 [Thermoleophilaceae bacterium]|nr:hypothetical protein [Thermoleophilaceae bacterium]